MICLFISEGCSSCRELLKEMPKEWASQITMLNVEFDKEKRTYRAYQDGKAIGEKSPVESVPTLCFFETEEVYSGYSDIIERLRDGSR